MKLLLVEVEGVDKCGKDVVKDYIIHLSNYKYMVHSRGVLSNMAYADRYNRNYDYELAYRPIIIYLTCEEEDRQVRCKMTREKHIDVEADKMYFDKYANILENQGVTIWRYNTSEMTPYLIAKDVINKLEQYERNF